MHVRRPMRLKIDLVISIGPRSKATHWNQTILYLEDVLTVREAETPTGSMTVEPNRKSLRDTEIIFKHSLNGRHCQVFRTQHYKMR